MYFLRKSGIYLVVLLLLVSIYKDLTSGLDETSELEKQKKPIEMELISQQFKVVKVKVQSGDTVLSIIEEVNNNRKTVDMTKLLSDFQTINNVDPHELKIGHYYYFPFYKNVNKQRD